MHEIGSFHQALHGAGIQPGKAAAQQLHIQLALFQVHIVQGSDLQLAAGGGLYLLCHLHHFLVVEVQAGDGVVGLGVCGLFFHAQHLAVLIKLHDAKALGVLHVIAEHGAAPLVFGVGSSGLEDLGKTVAVEDIITQDHGTAVIADELLAQNKCLCQAVRRGLHLILQMDTILAAIAQQRLKTGRVSRGRDDQDILDARQHEGGQRIVDHGLIVDRQQLFAGDHGQGIKPCAGTAGENNAFHTCALLFSCKKMCSLIQSGAASAVNKFRSAASAFFAKDDSSTLYFTMKARKMQGGILFCCAEMM